jgi:hypothetical protein
MSNAGWTSTTVILGAGPIGLVAALAAARHGRTLVVSRRHTLAADPPRVDAVPAAFLTLLLELGVHPSEVGVRDLHDTRLVAWEGAEPEIVRGPAVAHVERPALEQALIRAVNRVPGIEMRVLPPSAELPPARLVIDATGRAAVSAQRRIAPPQPWIARTFLFPGCATLAARALRIAALPGGYGYRLASGGLTVVALVGEKNTIRGPPDALELGMRQAGAGWLLAGVPPLRSARAGRSGKASVQWSEGETFMLRVGDAELARDALASQGMATGVSDALHLLADPGLTHDGLAEGGLAGGGAAEIIRSRRLEQRGRHLSALADTIARCRFHQSDSWAGYARFIVGFSPMPLPRPVS